MDNGRIFYLYNQHLKNELSPSEFEEFKSLLLDKKYEAKFGAILDERWDLLKEKVLLDVPETLNERLFENVVSHKQPSESLSVSLWPRMAIAATIALVLFGAGLFYLNTKKAATEQRAGLVEDIAPGRNSATLTLANGKRIVLSDVINGELAKESGISISKTEDGQIIYELTDRSETNIGKTNTLTTTKGETYRVRLPDGTLVVLNAASSLTFTVGGERRLSLTGEAYFEVFKDKKHPFVVKTNNQEIEVLGTQFNISSYGDDAEIKTTLLEGSVKVRTPNRVEILKPGQQASLIKDEMVIASVDTEEAISWKEGYFMFNDERLESIMKKISRWYNVDVVFEDESIKGESFGGRMNRFDHVSATLKIFEMTGKARFRIDGRKIIVSKQ